MNVLVACECSQVVTKAFRALGHHAYSCDLQDCYGGYPEWHLKGDALFYIRQGSWDLVIAHPPCTYLTVTGNKWFLPEYESRFPGRAYHRLDAVRFFLDIYSSDVPRLAIENPVGIMSSFLRQPDQYIEPFMFGDPERKKTGLWLKNLPKLEPTNIVEPNLFICSNGKTEPLWHMRSLNLDVDSRSRLRSQTFPGIADAMASQWGCL